MKHIKDIDDFFEDDFDDFTENNIESHIIVLIDSKLKIPTIDLIQEGIWQESPVENRIMIRVEGPHTPDGYRHVHISHSKHTNTKNKQVAWNDTGSRHDKKSFNTNFKGIEKAKNAARAALKLSDDIILESYTNKSNGTLILESAQSFLSSNNTIILIANKTKRKQLLNG